MAESRERSEWARMSQLLALTFNVHRDPKKSSPLTPSEVNPFERQSRDIVIENAPISVLKDVFIKRKVPKAAQTLPIRGASPEHRP